MRSACYRLAATGWLINDPVANDASIGHLWNTPAQSDRSEASIGARQLSRRTRCCKNTVNQNLVNDESLSLRNSTICVMGTDRGDVPTLVLVVTVTTIVVLCSSPVGFHSRRQIKDVVCEYL